MKKTKQERIFDIFNYTVMILIAATCIIPFLHVIAISLSSNYSAEAGLVGIWPKDLTFNSYEYVFRNSKFGLAMFVSMKRLFLGVGFSMLITIITAYPLSKTAKEFHGRTFWAWFIVITMLIHAGLIPVYLTVVKTGLRNSIWALVIPSSVPVFNIMILLNFFKGIPKEMEESALIDGVGQWDILFRIYVPLSMASLATLFIFQSVFHWNSWFDGMIYMDDSARYPLSTYLRSIVIDMMYSLDGTDMDKIRLLQEVNNKTFRAAQIIIASLPIMAVYPFLQRHFVKGVVLGSVKG